MSEIKEGVKETGEKMHAGAKAAGKKVANPDRDIDTEYEVEKRD